jgi:cell division protein FtsB
MAGRRFGARTKRARLKRGRPALVLVGRISAAALALLVVTLVSIQFARAIGENLGTARELSAIRSDITALERRRADQQREMQRLRDPQGAIPEIHDRLRLVRPNEALIFVSPQPEGAASAQP